MSYDKSVITELRRKISGEFETPVKLGAEQRYVLPMLNSHNNNLEEQNILGMDVITTSWTDENDIIHVVNKYYDGDPAHISGGYYIHFIFDYTNAVMASDCYFEGDTLYIPEYKDIGAKFEQDSSTGDWKVVFDDPNTVTYDAENQLLCIQPAFRLTRREVLCFRTNLSKDSVVQESDDIAISEKIITQKSDDEGRLITKSAIINYL